MALTKQDTEMLITEGAMEYNVFTRKERERNSLIFNNKTLTEVNNVHGAA